MNALFAALLLLALASATPAAAATLAEQRDWPIGPEESARINSEHERRCAALFAVVEKLAAKRAAYSQAPDPDAHLAEWAAMIEAVGPEMGSVMKMAQDHKDRTKALETHLSWKAVTTATTGGLVQNKVSAEFDFVQKVNEIIQTRNGKMSSRLWAEGDRFREASQARAELLRRSAADTRILLWVLAGFAALGALAYAGRRVIAGPPATVVLAAQAGGAPPPGPQAVPALIGGNIQVVRPIGRGGMGEVYEGLDKTLQRRVALKRLRPELVGSANDLSRLLNEARLVAALKHPNVVAIHSVEKEAGQVFLVFEYVDGPTLTTLISQRKQLRWPEALGIFQGACAALSAAHARNIVHRDLKPGNIMLDSKGTPKVMDFGIAHEAARVVSRLTRSGAWGTPPYMSPEQELGEVNTGVDLFALNVCLYEMLTGELPFTGPNFLAQKRERVYIPVSQAVPALPKALDAFFAKAFDPDPAKRFQDAAALSAAAGGLA